MLPPLNYIIISPKEASVKSGSIISLNKIINAHVKIIFNITNKINLWHNLH